MPPLYHHHLLPFLLFFNFCSAMMPFPQNGGAPMMNNQGPPMQQPFGAPVPAGGSLRARTMSGNGGPQPKRLADYEWIFQIPPNIVRQGLVECADGRVFHFDPNIPGFVVVYNNDVWEYNPKISPHYFHMDANQVAYEYDVNNGLFIPQVQMQMPQQLPPQAMPPFQQQAQQPIPQVLPPVQQQQPVFGAGMQQQPMMAGQSGNFGAGGVPGMPQQPMVVGGGLSSLSMRNRGAAGVGSGHSLRSSSISKRTQFFAATAGTETMKKWQQGTTKILDSSSIPSVVLQKHKNDDSKGLVMVDGKLKRLYAGHVNTQRIFVSTDRVQGDVMRKTKQH